MLKITLLWFVFIWFSFFIFGALVSKMFDAIALDLKMRGRTSASNLLYVLRDEVWTASGFFFVFAGVCAMALWVF